MRQNTNSKKKIYRHERKLDNFVQEFSILLADKGFKKEIDLIRDKFYNQQALKNSVPKLITKYGLNEKYEWAIMMYVIHGKVKKSDSPRYIEYYFEEDNNSASIIVYPYTTLEDVRKAYSHIIKKLKPGKQKRSRKAEQFERDKFIYEQKAKGLSNKDLLTLATREFGQKNLDLGTIGRADRKSVV